MYTEWKVKGSIGSTNSPVLIAKIRTEHEIIFSPETITKIKTIINILGDSNITELKEDNYRVIKDFEKMIDLYYSITDAYSDKSEHLIPEQSVQ